MNKRANIIFSVITAAFLIGGVVLVNAPREGEWRAAGDHDGYAWYQNWEIHNGVYSMEGYPPISESGWYTVASVEGDLHTLTMHPWGEKGAYELEMLMLGDREVQIGGMTMSR